MEQREAGDAYSVLEHVDVLLFVEAKLFGDGFEERRHVTFVISNYVFAKRLHPVIAPHGLTSCVIIVGEAFVLEATVERGLRW